jgi:hypothetical protein
LTLKADRSNADTNCDDPRPREDPMTAAKTQSAPTPAESLAAFGRWKSSYEQTILESLAEVIERIEELAEAGACDPIIIDGQTISNVTVIGRSNLEEQLEAAAESRRELAGLRAFAKLLADERLQDLLGRVAAAWPSADWRSTDVCPTSDEAKVLMEYHHGALDFHREDETVIDRLFDELSGGAACDVAAQTIRLAWEPNGWTS